MQKRRNAHYSLLDTTKQEKRPRNVQPPSVQYEVVHLAHMPKQSTVFEVASGATSTSCRPKSQAVVSLPSMPLEFEL